MFLPSLDRQKRIYLTIAFYSFFAWFFTSHLTSLLIKKLEWGLMGGYLSILSTAFAISITGVVIYVFASKYFGFSLIQRQLIRISSFCTIPLFIYQVTDHILNPPTFNSFQIISVILVHFIVLFLFDFILLGIISSLLFHIFRVSKKIIFSFIIVFFISLFTSRYVMSRPCEEMGCIPNLILPPYVFIIVFMVAGVIMLLVHQRFLKNKALPAPSPAAIPTLEIPIPKIDTHISMRLWVMGVVCVVTLVAVFAMSRPPASPSAINGVSINRITPTLGAYYDPMMDEINIYWNDFDTNAIHVLNRNTQKNSTLDVRANYFVTSDYFVLYRFGYPVPDYSLSIYDKKTLTSQIVRLGKIEIRNVEDNTIVYYKQADERAHRDYFTYDLSSKIETPFYLEKPYEVFLSNKKVIYTELDYPARITRFYSTVPGKEGRILLFTLQPQDRPCNIDVNDQFVVWTSCDGSSLVRYNLLTQQRKDYITSTNFNFGRLFYLTMNGNYAVWEDHPNIKYFDFNKEIEGKIEPDPKNFTRNYPYLFDNKIVYTESEKFGAGEHVDIFTIPK